MQKIIPFSLFVDNAVEATAFYTSVTLSVVKLFGIQCNDADDRK